MRNTTVRLREKDSPDSRERTVMKERCVAERVGGEKAK